MWREVFKRGNDGEEVRVVLGVRSDYADIALVSAGRGNYAGLTPLPTRGSRPGKLRLVHKTIVSPIFSYLSMGISQ